MQYTPLMLCFAPLGHLTLTIFSIAAILELPQSNLFGKKKTMCRMLLLLSHYSDF